MRKVLFGILGSMLVAWILTFFNVNRMLFDVVSSVFPQIELTNSHYYVAFIILGLVIGAVRPSKKD